MDFIDGIIEYSAEEFEKKEAAHQSVSKPLLSLTAGKIKDEFYLDYTDNHQKTANFSYHLAAVNALLGWLEFPSHLRSLLDSVIALSMGSDKEFAATDLELGLQMKPGRRSNSGAAKKNCSRAKKSFRQWQVENKIQLIKISGRNFNAKKQKNEPTQYHVFINEWAAQTIVVAQNDFASDWRRRETRCKAIRKAAKEILLSLEDAPPMESVTTKTLTISQAWDREDTYINAALNRQRERAKLSNQDFSGYAEKKRLQITMLETNEAGMVGTIITPEGDVPVQKTSSWFELISGDIYQTNQELADKLNIKTEHLEAVGYDRIEYAAQVVKSENRHIETPGKFAGGEWSHNSNEIPLVNDEIPKGQNETEICTNQAKNDANLLNSLSVEGTFSASENKEKALVSHYQKTVNEWLKRIAEKMPDAPPAKLQSGAWQFYKWEVYTTAGIEAEIALGHKIQSIAAGIADESELKPMFIDYAMTRVEYYKNGVPMRVSEADLNKFKSRLQDFIEMPGTNSDA